MQVRQTPIYDIRSKYIYVSDFLLLCEVVQRNMRCPALVGKTKNAWVKYGLEEKEKECVRISQTFWHHLFASKNLGNAPLGVRRAEWKI